MTSKKIKSSEPLTDITEYQNNIQLGNENRNAKNELIFIKKVLERIASSKITYDLPSDSSYSEMKEIVDSLAIQTYSEYMNAMMFDPSDGYYGNGKAQIGSDFDTNVSKNNFLAFLMTLHMFDSWQKAGNPDRYIYCEGGAGNGKLAYEILTFVEFFANEENTFSLVEQATTNWHAFYKALSYHIIEIAPGMIEKQKEYCKKFITQNKLTIIQQNACQPIFCNLFFANELLDDFLLESLIKDNAGNLLLQAKLYTLHLNELSLTNFPISYTELKEIDQHNRENIKKIIDITLTENEFIIDKSLWIKLKKQYKDHIRVHDIYLDARLFPSYYSLIEDNPGLMESLKPNQPPFFVNINISSFVNAITADKILILDYGGLPLEVENDPRVFGRGDEFNITHDVSFELLAYHLDKKGFSIDHYGHQSGLVNLLDPQLVNNCLTKIIEKFEQNESCHSLHICKDHAQEFIRSHDNFKFIFSSKKQSLELSPSNNKSILIVNYINIDIDKGLFISGEFLALGSWKQAIPLQRINKNTWAIELDFFLIGSQYKILLGRHAVKNQDISHLLWEEGPNRTLTENPVIYLEDTLSLQQKNFWDTSANFFQSQNTTSVIDNKNDIKYIHPASKSGWND